MQATSQTSWKSEQKQICLSKKHSNPKKISESLTGDDKLMYDDLIDGMRRNGCHLDKATNARCKEISEELSEIILENGDFPEFYLWNTNTLFPLFSNGDFQPRQLIGLLGIADVQIDQLDENRITSQTQQQKVVSVIQPERA